MGVFPCHSNSYNKKEIEKTGIKDINIFLDKPTVCELKSHKNDSVILIPPKQNIEKIKKNKFRKKRNNKNEISETLKFIDFFQNINSFYSNNILLTQSLLPVKFESSNFSKEIMKKYLNESSNNGIHQNSFKNLFDDVENLYVRFQKKNIELTPEFEKNSLNDYLPKESINFEDLPRKLNIIQENYEKIENSPKEFKESFIKKEDLSCVGSVFSQTIRKIDEISKISDYSDDSEPQQIQINLYDLIHNQLATRKNSLCINNKNSSEESFY